MTGKQWRASVELFVQCLEDDLNKEYEPLDKDANDDVKCSAYYDVVGRKCFAEGQLQMIRGHLNNFKRNYLNREICDDFDE